MSRWTARNLEEVGRFFNVSKSAAENWRSKGMPGTRGKWDLKEIFDWWRNEFVGDRKAEPDSPALERYRAAKARIAEMDADEREGELCHVPSVIEAMMMAQAPLNSAVQELRLRLPVKQFNLVAEAINSAWAEVESNWEKIDQQGILKGSEI